jgi:excisionase family DNA binding protein
MSDLVTVSQVADLLGLHIKTVRGYVRDGRLKATRIGKSYRIARADLAAFTGGPVGAPARETAQRQRQADVSSVVQLDAVSPELMSRLSTLITAAAATAPADAERLHIQTIYNEEYASMKIILIGGLNRTAETLKLISALADA